MIREGVSLTAASIKKPPVRFSSGNLAGVGGTLMYLAAKCFARLYNTYTLIY